MSGPALLNLSLYIGDTWARTFNLVDDGVAIDMTGYVPRIQLRATPNSSAIEADWGPDYFTGDQSVGEFILTVPADETADLRARAYSYDFEITDGAEEVRTYLFGTLTASKDVTR